MTHPKTSKKSDKSPSKSGGNGLLKIVLVTLLLFVVAIIISYLIER